MSIKNKLLKEIDKKAQKIREKRVEAANNKSLESAVFDFFRNIEESRQLHDGKQYDSTLFSKARSALEQRIQGYAPGTKISIEWQSIEHNDPNIAEKSTVRGVTIWWSKIYIAQNNVDPSLCIDISQMLFF